MLSAHSGFWSSGDSPSPYLTSVNAVDDLGSQIYSELKADVNRGKMVITPGQSGSIYFSGRSLVTLKMGGEDQISVPVGKVDPGTTLIGSTATDGKSWCFVVENPKTDTSDNGGYYSNVYTNNGMVGYGVTALPKSACVLGVVGKIKGLTNPNDDSGDSGDSGGTGYVSYGLF